MPNAVETSALAGRMKIFVYPVQHGDDVLGVVEAANVLVVAAVDNGHRLVSKL
jgi:hypothetical protein